MRLSPNGERFAGLATRRSLVANVGAGLTTIGALALLSGKSLGGEIFKGSDPGEVTFGLPALSPACWDNKGCFSICGSSDGKTAVVVLDRRSRRPTGSRGEPQLPPVLPQLLFQAVVTDSDEADSCSGFG